MLGNKKMGQVDSFTYIGSINSEKGRCSEDSKSRLGNAHFFVFLKVEKSLEEDVK